MGSHALISSHNPITKQRPAPCMTIRLTPQILSQLSQTPPPEISFCIKDRALTIGNIRHPLQAFVEDPSLCEVYSLRSDRLVQIGNLEHKLIVQREVNAKNASNTSGCTPKVSESNSTHSNPLAPRQSVSSRAKRPRDSGVSMSATKRPASSNSSTPRRPVSQSPMELKSASPDMQPSSIASNKSSKVNSSLSLRDQVLHLLAIQPMSAAGIGRRLSQPSKNLAAILKAVAHYEIPGKYRLRDDLFANVRIELWPYSEHERNLVLRNIESVLTKPKEGRSQEAVSDLTSLSIEGDTILESIAPVSKLSSKTSCPSIPEVSSSRTSPRRSSIHRKPPTVDVSSSKRIQDADMSQIRSDTSDPSKRINTSSPIRTHEEYLLCRSRFEQMYPRYSAVDSRLKEIAAEFNSLAVKLDSPQCPSAERRKLQQQVKELYSQLKPEVDRLKLEFNGMHEEMSILKSRVRNYVDTVLTPV